MTGTSFRIASILILPRSSAFNQNQEKRRNQSSVFIHIHLFAGEKETWDTAVVFLVFFRFLFDFFRDLIRDLDRRFRLGRHLDLRQIKAGGDDCHDDRFADLLVNRYAEDDVDVIAGRFADVFDRVVRVVNRNVRAAGDVDDRLLGAR